VRLFDARHSSAADVDDARVLRGVATTSGLDPDAVFVRLMERHVVSDVDKVLDMLDWARLNEFRRTRIPR
jgi:hypothetical protein